MQSRYPVCKSLMISCRYDMDFSGSFWSSNAFVRDVYNATLTKVVYPALGLQDEVETVTKKTV